MFQPFAVEVRQHCEPGPGSSRLGGLSSVSGNARLNICLLKARYLEQKDAMLDI